MENASKALLIAGSVLITLAIISLLVFGYEGLSEWQQTVDDSEQTRTDTEFMRQVEQFNRDLYGSELLSLMNYVEDYNARLAGDGYAEIEFNVQIRRDIQGTSEYFTSGNYDLQALYDEVKGPNGIETRIEQYEEPNSNYNDKSVRYYWTKTYREIASEFGITVPSDTPTSELESTILEAAGLQAHTIEDLIEDIREYDLLDSIYTQFREGKRFEPDPDNGFVYDNDNGRIIQINFVEI